MNIVLILVIVLIKKIIKDTFSHVYDYEKKLELFGNRYDYNTYTGLVETLDNVTKAMIYYRQGDMDAFDKLTKVDKFLALFLLGQRDQIEKYMPTEHYKPFLDLLDGKVISYETLERMMAEMAKSNNILGIRYFQKLGVDINSQYVLDHLFMNAKLRIDATLYLLDQGVNKYDILRRASSYGNLDIIHRIFELGIDVSDKRVRDAFLLAIRYKHADIVEFMINQGVDIHFDGEYPLMQAIDTESVDMIKLLIKHGADVNYKGEPLIRAIKNRSLDIVKLLIDLGALYNIDDHNPLVFAAEFGRDVIVEYFLTWLGMNKYLEEALKQAAIYGHYEIVKMLVENGAAITDEIISGAQKSGYDKIVKYLRKHKEPHKTTLTKESEILNVYDLLQFDKIEPGDKRLTFEGKNVNFIGNKYIGKISNPKVIGEGWNGTVICCANINGEDVVLKYSKRGESFRIEFIVYYQLLTYFKFPVVPIVDHGDKYEFLLRKYLDPKFFGNNIIPNEKQREKLTEIWIQANRFALITGIPLDLKPDNLWWDNNREEWLLVDTGPRLDDGDIHKFAYTLDPVNADQYIDTYFVNKQGEDALKAIVQLEKWTKKILLTTGSTALDAFTKNSLLNVNINEKINEKIKDYSAAGNYSALKIYMKGALLTEEILEYSRSDIAVSKLLCETHKICPSVPTYKQFKTEIDTIVQLRRDTENFHKTLTSDEKEVFKFYTGAGYRNMNDCLRSKDVDSCKPNIVNFINTMEKVLSRNDAPKTKGNIYVYRGIDPSSSTDAEKFAKRIKNLKIGDIIEDRAFVSTSVQHPPSGFIGKTCCLLKIRVPSGTPAYYIGEDSSSSSEEEVILLPGTSFKLTDIKPRGTVVRGNKTDTFVFECPSCLTNERYLLSRPPKDFSLYEDIRRKSDYQIVDKVVGKDRLNLYELVLNNKYIPDNYSEIVRIMTWNVHEFRDARGIDRDMNEVIKQLNPDILGLQEVISSVDNPLPLTAGSCTADQGSHGRLRNTLTIGSTTGIKPSDLQYKEIDLGPHDRCGISSMFSFPKFGEFHIINVHLEVRSEKDRRENIKRLLSEIKFPEKTIIMGDFNSYKREDYIPDNLTILKEIKKDYGLDFETIKLLEDAGWVDVYQQKAYELGVKLTDIVPVNTSDKGGRIDFIFLHRDSKFLVNNTYVYYTDVSDHIPVIVDLKLDPDYHSPVGVPKEKKEKEKKEKEKKEIPKEKEEISKIEREYDHDIPPLIPVKEISEKTISLSDKMKLGDQITEFAKEGDLEGVKSMRSKGVTEHGYKSALREASDNGHLDIVKYLIEEIGVDVHSFNDIALRWAAENGHLEVVKYLIEKGADPSVYDNQALKSASYNKHIDVVNYLKSLV